MSSNDSRLFGSEILEDMAVQDSTGAFIDAAQHASQAVENVELGQVANLLRNASKIETANEFGDAPCGIIANQR